MTKKRFLITMLFVISLFGCKESDVIDEFYQEPPEEEQPLEELQPGSIYSFKIKSETNPYSIQEDIKLSIEGTNIYGRVPYYSNLSAIVATFEFEGEAVYINDVKQVSDETNNDFTKDLIYTVVSSAGDSVKYNVSITNFTGLPKIGRAHG
jgi:hypothetical protein